MKSRVWRGWLGLMMLLVGAPALAAAAPGAPLRLSPGDVIPTGNDWIALPSIRTADGALDNFNVLSMHYRGLLQASGPTGAPLIAPFLTIDGKRQPFAKLSWSVQGYWVPTGAMRQDGIEATLTWVALPGHRAALLRLTVTNRRSVPITAGLGADVNWAALTRVTYAPVPLTGTRSMRPAPWDRDMQVFSYGVDDAAYSWAFSYPGATATLRAGAAPGLTATREARLAPGETLDVHFTLAVGIEEYGVTKTVTVVDKLLDRIGVDGAIASAAADAAHHTRSTGDAALDLLMNRNFLFTTYFAWGRTIDTEQLVGVTSRSDRYYVSAAYWDRDAMLWSFPALLDTDPARAREALTYALDIQGRNAGVHSRYIDGVVLEDGFELDELVAPLIATADYLRKTKDAAFVSAHAAEIAGLRKALATHRDPATGLYDTFQDAQDEYIKKPFQIYDNVLVWKALGDLARLNDQLGDKASAKNIAGEADRLRDAILRHGVGMRPGGTGPILASAVDGHSADFSDVPPGSLMKLPALGFLAEDDPLFDRTYRWLHGPNYRWSYTDQPFGLPGSYRLPFTTSWAVADHLRLTKGRAQALKVLQGSSWDGSIMTEGVRPETGLPEQSGRAFATAAGYVAHAMCDTFCR